jgi:Tol biopolymer transport system component
MNPDGTGVKQLTKNGVTDFGPAWSPDGTQITFTRYEDDYEIHKMRADGTDQTRLTDNAADDWQLTP